jgi:hypothetical protein
MASESAEKARWSTAPSALLMMASADGSWTVRRPNREPTERSARTSPLGTGVVVLITVLVGGPCVQLRHGSFLSGLHSARSASIGILYLICIVISVPGVFHVPRAGMTLSGHGLDACGSDRSLYKATHPTQPRWWARSKLLYSEIRTGTPCEILSMSYYPIIKGIND